MSDGLAIQNFFSPLPPIHSRRKERNRVWKWVKPRTVSHPPYRPDLAPCDFCLFPNLGGCRYETIEVALTKIIDTLTWEHFHWAFQKLLERYNQCIAAGGDYFEGDKSFMCVLSIKVPIRKTSGNLLNYPRIYICIYIYAKAYETNTTVLTYFFIISELAFYKIVNHHHHVVPPARISLILSRHFLLFIASGRSSALHPVSSHSCCMWVRAAFVWPYVGVHRSRSLMSSSLLLQQCPTCLVRLTCIVFVMGGKWPYSWCLVGCCRQDLFNMTLNILV